MCSITLTKRLSLFGHLLSESMTKSFLQRLSYPFSHTKSIRSLCVAIAYPHAGKPPTTHKCPMNELPYHSHRCGALLCTLDSPFGTRPTRYSNSHYGRSVSHLHRKSCDERTYLAYRAITCRGFIRKTSFKSRCASTIRQSL